MGTHSVRDSTLAVSPESLLQDNLKLLGWRSISATLMRKWTTWIDLVAAVEEMGYRDPDYRGSWGFRVDMPTSIQRCFQLKLQGSLETRAIQVAYGITKLAREQLWRQVAFVAALGIVLILAIVLAWQIPKLIK